MAAESEISSSYDPLSFLDLPWEQILCSHILPYLSFPDLFNLRCVSKGFLELVETHFSRQFHINTCQLGDNCSQAAFSIISRDATCLKTLILKGAKSWLTNDILLPVISSNPHLEKIDLAGCIALSGCCVYAVGATCPRIKHLSLRNCVWLSGENLSSFLFNRRQLEYLDLSGCWNLGDDVIVNLVQHCPSIKQLLLSNIYGITDRALCAVAHCCSNLQALSIQGCWRVTDFSISMLAEYCLNLRMLLVKECRDVTEKSLATFRQRKVVIDKAAPPSAHMNRLEYLNHLQRINLAL